MGFFDKLRGGVEEPPKKEKGIKKPKIEVKEEAVKKEGAKEEAKPRKEKLVEEPKEGELAIDVYETEGEFVIQSTIAGVKPEDLDIAVENDMVTIKGSRTRETEEIGKKYYYQECYWGSFSRQVILPEEVDGSKAEATIKNGVLILKIPKVRKIQRRKIIVKSAE